MEELKERNNRIYRDRVAGATLRALAEEYELSLARIQYLVEREKKNE